MGESWCRSLTLGDSLGRSRFATGHRPPRRDLKKQWCAGIAPRASSASGASAALKRMHKQKINKSKNNVLAVNLLFFVPELLSSRPPPPPLPVFPFVSRAPCFACRGCDTGGGEERSWNGVLLHLLPWNIPLAAAQQLQFSPSSSARLSALFLALARPSSPV